MQLPLFNTSKNLLPYDGELYYHHQFYDSMKSARFYEQLLHEIIWEHDRLRLFGKEIITQRKVAFYAEKSLQYTYSNTTKTAHLYPQWFYEMQQKVNEFTGYQYNACLLNLYHSGAEGMTWHCDDEEELDNNHGIASLSFGAIRIFKCKHKTTKEKVSVDLHPGSLLLMQGSIQTHWLHALPKTVKVKTPRINLTFRKFTNG